MLRHNDTSSTFMFLRESFSSPFPNIWDYLRLKATVLNLSAVTWSNRSCICVSVSVTGRLRNWAKSSTTRWSPSSFLARLASSSNTLSVVFALCLLIHRHNIMLLWHIQSQGCRHAWHTPQHYVSPSFLVGYNHPKHKSQNTFPKGKLFNAPCVELSTVILYSCIILLLV